MPLNLRTGGPDVVWGLVKFSKIVAELLMSIDEGILETERGTAWEPNQGVLQRLLKAAEYGLSGG